MKKLPVASLFVAAGVLLLTLLMRPNTGFTQGPAQDLPTVIEGATLIDGTGASPLADSVVVIAGDRIQAVGQRGSMAYPQGAKIIDAEGEYVLPGLIDGHVHGMEWALELLLAHGVTTIIEPGGGSEWSLALRDGIAKGRIRGPRIFSGAGNIRGPVNPDDPYFFLDDPYYFKENPNSTRPQSKAPSVEEAMQIVERGASLGLTWIKVYDGATPMIKAIFEVADRHGMRKIGHTRNAREAVDFGYDMIVHTKGIARGTIKDPEVLRRVDNAADLNAYMDFQEADRLIADMVANGIFLNPTLRSEWGWAWKEKFQKEDFDLLFNNPGLTYIPLGTRLSIVNEYNQLSVYWARSYTPFAELSPSEQEMKRKALQNVLEFVKRFVDAGGKLVSGTDTLSTYGLSLHQELQILVEEVGLSPMQAILTATKYPVEFLRVEDRLGSIETGKLADLLIVEDNPLQDIRNLRKVKMVFKEGKIMDISYHPDYVIPFPATRPMLGSSHSFPFPLIKSLSPEVVTEGDGPLELTINGTGLIPQSIVHFKDVPVPTQFINLFQLQARIPADLLEKGGVFPVKVVNPSPAGSSTHAVGAEEIRLLGLLRGEKSNEIGLIVKFN